jgi:hypothetical protein
VKKNTIKVINNWIIALLVVASVGGAMLTIATPQVAVAVNCNVKLLGFPAWYNNLPKDANCNIKSPVTKKESNADYDLAMRKFIWIIAFNIVQMGLVAAIYLSGFFFLYGGWLLILSQGKPEGITKGKSTMTMAMIGLILSISAVALVDFIVDRVINFT